VEVVLANDDPRLQAFLEARVIPLFLHFLPMAEHLAIFASLRRELEGRDLDGIELEGPFEVRLYFAGRGDPLELRVAVEGEEPHRIEYVAGGAAGPEIAAQSLEGLQAELQRLADEDAFSGVVLALTADGVRFHEAFGPADRTVTVEELLKHRSGLGDYLAHPEFEADPNRFVEPADFLPLARTQAPAFEPGTATRYSNLGFVLLGAIIEVVTGQGYHEVIHELVFRPAELRTAGPAGGPEAARRYHRIAIALLSLTIAPCHPGAPSPSVLRRISDSPH
jgi:hypothetical protein